MSRHYLVAGNWKMNLGIKEAGRLAEAIITMKKGNNTKVIIAPSFVCLPAVSEIFRDSDVILAAQNMADAESGAHTGETSVLMLMEIGIKAVILGHSERRHIYGETDGLINRKVKLALKHNFDVILCIGETLKERERGQVDEVCFRQIQEGLAGVSRPDKITIAYEPVWAIGTGKTATPHDAQVVHSACRTKLGKLYSTDVAESILIQYGGSVKPSNVSELMAEKDIDGALVGGASLDEKSFSSIMSFNA